MNESQQALASVSQPSTRIRASNEVRRAAETAFSGQTLAPALFGLVWASSENFSPAQKVDEVDDSIRIEVPVSPRAGITKVLADHQEIEKVHRAVDVRITNLGNRCPGCRTQFIGHDSKRGIREDRTNRLEQARIT